MSWQDAVIGIGQFLFTLALIPSILGDEKPARATCAMTAATLFVFTGAYWSMNLWLSAASCALCGTCWSVLLFQKRAK